MGIDLSPLQGAESLHFNWSGWRFVVDFADKHGIDTSEFAGSNDGEVLPDETCRALADQIEDHHEEWNAAFAGESYGLNPAAGHAVAFRTAGGFEQF